MAVKQSIFGSKSEERGFRSIEHTWGDDYRVIPQFPFSALFEPDKRMRGTGTSNLFFKTSLDYLLSTKRGQPLLAIDFDGLGDGFNRNITYVAPRNTDDPNRKAKFEFKMNYAMKNAFPYYIVGYDEIKQIDSEIKLTIVDGLIGAELARQDLLTSLPGLVEADQDFISTLSPTERQDYFENLVLEQEMDSDYKYNPIVKRIAKLRYEIGKTWGTMGTGESYRYFEEPELPSYDREYSSLFSPDAASIEILNARVDAMKYVERLGCEVTLLDTPIGEVSETAWMRNIGYSFQHTSVVKEIAELLAWTKVARLLKRKRG